MSAPMRTIRAYGYIATKDFSLEGTTGIILIHGFDERHAAQILRSHVDATAHRQHVIHHGPFDVRKISIQSALGVSR